MKKHYIIYIIYIHSTSKMSVVTKDPPLNQTRPPSHATYLSFPTTQALDTPNFYPKKNLLQLLDRTLIRKNCILL